jgi:hypothetical protein
METIYCTHCDQTVNVSGDLTASCGCSAYRADAGHDVPAAWEASNDIQEIVACAEEVAA